MDNKFKNNFTVKLTRPTIDALKKYVGYPVKITFTDGEVEEGTLGFTEEFSERYDYRKPNYFTLGDLDFKASHIKSATVVPFLPIKIKTQNSGLFYGIPKNPSSLIWMRGI